jgi:hypothetical protein
LTTVKWLVYTFLHKRTKKKADYLSGEEKLWSLLEKIKGNNEKNALIYFIFFRFNAETSEVKQNCKRHSKNVQPEVVTG